MPLQRPHGLVLCEAPPAEGHRVDDVAAPPVVVAARRHVDVAEGAGQALGAAAGVTLRLLQVSVCKNRIKADLLT